MIFSKYKFLWVLSGLLLVTGLVGTQILKPAPKTGDWQTHLAIPSLAEFNGDGTVLIKNVRNFRYFPTEADIHPAYYDKIYDTKQLKKIWYVTEPFKGSEYAAHTFLSFEFENGDFLSITIEARKTKAQQYSTWQGVLRSYPLIYIAADERDTILLRANLRKDDVFVYPIKTSSPENGQKLLIDMLERMNQIIEKPVWYNSFFANCTSSIVHHVNHVATGRVSPFSWQLILTGHADELAYNLGLLDTNLSLEDARKKYRINDRSEAAGDVENYSQLIRHTE